MTGITCNPSYYILEVNPVYLIKAMFSCGDMTIHFIDLANQ